jgi:benzoylformate decarboxylase
MSYTGIHCFLDLLHAYGISTIFGNPGTTELPLNDALLTDSRFEYRLGLHEVPVVAMADGFTQASGRVSCVNLHTCCGLGNAMGMLYNAYQEGTPLLMTAGQQDRRLRQAEPVLEGDMVRVAQPWTKWAFEVQHTEDLPAVLKRAVQTALTPPRGPVFLSLPLDLQMAATAPPDLQQYGLTVPSLGPAANLDRAAQILLDAECPVILAGSRVTESDSIQELERFAERLGAPVFYESATSHGRLPISADHPLTAGPLPLWSPDIAATLAPFDAVFAVGLNLFRLYLHFEPEFPIASEIPIVQLDHHSGELGKNAAPQSLLWGDIEQTLRSLNHEVSRQLDSNHQAKLEQRKTQVTSDLSNQRTARRKAIRGQSESGDALNPQSLMLSIVETAPPRLAVVEEAVTTTQNILETFGTLSEAEGYFGHRGWALGWGAGFACGVQMAWPDRPVLAILGDGAAMYGLQAFWSAIKYDFPVTFLICNNSQYQILKDGAKLLDLPQATQNRFLGMDLTGPNPDFTQLAQGFGLPAVRVETQADLKAALATRWQSRNGPMLIEAILKPPERS